jgi:leucyl aminopeptidase
MDIKIRKASPLEIKTSCMAIALSETDFSKPLLKELDQKLGGLLLKAKRNGEFSAKEGEQVLFQPAGHLPAERILLVGLGIQEKITDEKIRRAAGQAMNMVTDKKFGQMAFSLPFQGAEKEPAAPFQALAEGLLLASYRYDLFLGEEAKKTRKLPKAVTLVITEGQDKKSCEVSVENARKIAQAVMLTRDLVNAPGNIKSPAYLAEQAQAAAKQSTLNCTVLGPKELAKEGCGALLGVAQGSAREPRLIILEHRGGHKNEAPVALVGKGVTFDSGGISLKPGEKMDEMKMDMAGGAAVIGTMLAASLLDLPVNLVGIVAAVENMPSATAYRPGDILTSLSGQTIEVLNTDAEGRLILADALTYVKRYDPKLVVDLATLTGACIIALGHHATAVLGNDQTLVDTLLKAGEDSGERLWQLPLWEDYDQQIKSDVADVKNTGGRPAGTITAAAFLKKFAKDFNWAHLDIAGTAWRDQATPYTPKGGTGVGVRLLLAFLKNL